MNADRHFGDAHEEKAGKGGGRCPSPASRVLAASFVAIVLAAGSVWPSQASGQELRDAWPKDAWSGSDLVEAGPAWFDVPDGKTESAALEFAIRRGSPVAWRLGLRAGGVLATNGAAYGYGAVELPVELHRRLAVALSLGGGAYHQGNGVDLGSVIAFRSSIAAEYRLAGGDQVRLYLYHLSNAGIGRRNPGVEVVGVGYALAR